MRNIFNITIFTMRKVFKIIFLIPSRDNITVQVRKYCEFTFKVFRSDYPFFKSLIYKNYAKHEKRHQNAMR